MKELKFKNEFETADMVVSLEMAEANFTVTGRTTIMVNEDETALVLPPTFVANLKRRLVGKGVTLNGVTKKGESYKLRTSEGEFTMKGVFSVNDVMRLWA